MLIYVLMFVRLFDCRLYDCMTVEFEGILNKLDSSLLLRQIILLSTTARMEVTER